MATLQQSFSLFPLRKLLTWAVNSSIAQSYYCISNDVKAKCRSRSRKFHGEMTLFAPAFAKPMKIRARLFLFNKPIKCLAFLFTFCFYVYFSRSYESHSNINGLKRKDNHAARVARILVFLCRTRQKQQHDGYLPFTKQTRKFRLECKW